MCKITLNIAQQLENYFNKHKDKFDEWLKSDFYLLMMIKNHRQNIYLKYLTELSNKGHSAAQNNLAFAYGRGTFGLAVNNTKAVHLYTLAAENGFAVAQHNLAIAYAHGHLGLEVNNTEAVRLFTLAANQGYAAAQHNLAIAYVRGKLGLEINNTEAVRLFTLAANQGLAVSQYNLAFAYARGKLGLEVNNTEAVRLYTLAANQGLALAQHFLKHLINIKENQQLGQPVNRSNEVRDNFVKSQIFLGRMLTPNMADSIQASEQDIATIKQVSQDFELLNNFYQTQDLTLVQVLQVPNGHSVDSAPQVKVEKAVGYYKIGNDVYASVGAEGVKLTHDLMRFIFKSPFSDETYFETFFNAIQSPFDSVQVKSAADASLENTQKDESESTQKEESGLDEEMIAGDKSAQSSVQKELKDLYASLKTEVDAFLFYVTSGTGTFVAINKRPWLVGS